MACRGMQLTSSPPKHHSLIQKLKEVELFLRMKKPRLVPILSNAPSAITSSIQFDLVLGSICQRPPTEDNALPKGVPLIPCRQHRKPEAQKAHPERRTFGGKGSR
ncbi:hypothetical protein CEXT_33661 [Caerostris extrusa]|uniref:Uncharacterized protein n=1 Tax=Caerostris extrusa TaxID=172846 RepID=A0AAV4PQD4_CAEEX|nr:hypothetical protein CEXT_33661 [Caerostris extrusa]